MEEWFAARAETVAEIRTSEDVIVARVGRELYEKFFQGYTRKHWGLDPSQLDASVTARVPVRTNRDDRYFTDKFQAMPRDGYTKMFKRMLDHPGIEVCTGVDYADLGSEVNYRRMIWTGPVDEFFDFRYGRLPYRSLRFRHESHATERFQQVGTVNYPMSEDYTRVSEYRPTCQWAALASRCRSTRYARHRCGLPGRRPFQPPPSMPLLRPRRRLEAASGALGHVRTSS